MKSKIDRIKELGELLTSGVISKEEFNSLKAEILGSIKDRTETSKVKDGTDLKKPSVEPPKKQEPVVSERSIPDESVEKTKEDRESELFQETDQFWDTFHASLEAVSFCVNPLKHHEASPNDKEAPPSIIQALSTFNDVAAPHEKNQFTCRSENLFKTNKFAGQQTLKTLH